jgi:hypothetical protein
LILTFAFYSLLEDFVEEGMVEVGVKAVGNIAAGDFFEFAALSVVGEDSWLVDFFEEGMVLWALLPQWELLVL